jgi:hypothetical protein
MTRKLGKAIPAWLALWAMAAPLAAQRPDAITLVPAAAWQLVGTRTLDVEAVREWGGDPVVEREYGVRHLELRTYRLRGQEASVLIGAALDSTAAYGLLTYYRHAEMQPVRGMEHTWMEPASALMGRGRIFIRARHSADRPISENDFRALLILVAGSRVPRGTEAELPSALPTEGLVPGSEKYLLGLETARKVLPNFRTDLLGFTQGAEVHVGTYRRESKNLTLLAISYPTPQMARIRFGAMENLLGVNQVRDGDSVYGRREGSYVLLVLGSSAPGPANRLINQFQVAGSITWDEEPPPAKPLAMELVELILANVFLILILVGISIGGGIMVFVARRAAARWAPENHWANPDADKLIRLNLR